MLLVPLYYKEQFGIHFVEIIVEFEFVTSERTHEDVFPMEVPVSLVEYGQRQFIIFLDLLGSLVIVTRDKSMDVQSLISLTLALTL